MTGLVFNVVAGLWLGIPLKSSKLFILGRVLQFCIVISCLFLADAIRRLQKVKQYDEVISKTPFILLFFSYGVLGILQIIYIPAEKTYPSRFYDGVILCGEVVIVLSCLTLAVILIQLIVKQH